MTQTLATRLALLVLLLAPTLTPARPEAPKAPRDLTVVFQPAPRPTFDLGAAERRTQEYEELRRKGELLARDRVYDQGLAGLVDRGLAAAGTRGERYSRFRFPGRLSGAELEKVQAAAQAIGDARAALRASHVAALRYLDQTDAEGRPPQVRARANSDRSALEGRVREADDLLDRLQRGLTLKAGGGWSRFGLWCRQLVGRDPAATAEELGRVFAAWGALRGDVLGAELTYVRGSVSAVEFPSTSTVPAHAAAAVGALSLEDASEGSEIELDAALRAKAGELGNALEAWRFVQDHARLDWYYGSLKGSAETLRSLRGNDTDLAGLLVALLRAQGTPARYVRGTIEVPVARLAGAMGLLAEVEALGSIPAARVAALRDLEVATLTAAGIPFEPVTAGGELAAFRLLHTWVEAYLPYGDYRGAGKGQGARRWVPLDPSFAGAAKYAASAPQFDAFAGQGLSVDGLIGEYLGGATTASPLELTQTRVSERLADLSPGTGYAGALRTVTPRPEGLPLLPGALPYLPRVVHDEFAFLPDEAKHRVRITARDTQGALMDVTLPAHQLVGHRAIFSYRPATSDDEQQIAMAGGIYETAAALVRVLPVLRVDGVERAVATRAVGLGARHEWSIELLLPDGSSRRITNQIVAGNIVALGFGAPGNSRTDEPSSPSGGDLEGEAGRFLYRIAARYSTQWTEAEDELARLLQVVPVRPTANVVLISNQLQVDELLGVPRRILWKGLEVDADHRSLTPVELVAGRGKQLLRLSGHQGSWLEAQVLTDATHEQAVCAVTLLQEARRQGVPVLEITPENYGTTIGGLTASPEVLADVEDLVARKRHVLVPIAPLTIGAWTGTGYVARDLATEEGGYFLSGRISGGQTVVSPQDWKDQDLVAMLERPDAPRATKDLTQIARIAKSPASDFQQTVVGKAWKKPLVVYVTTGEGVPVSGAKVTFRSIAESRPEFVAIDSVTIPAPAPVASVVTDEYGRATVMAFPDESITTLGILQPGVPNRQLVGLDRVTAEVERANGDHLVLADPFTLTALPDAPALVGVREPDTWGAPTKMILGTELPATVTDRYHNPLANQTVTWTQAPATGAFIEPKDREADRIVLLNPGDPRQQPTLVQITDTAGQVVVNYINGGGHHTLHAVAGEAVGEYTVWAVGTDSVEYVLGYVPSGRSSFDGIMGTYFPEPFVFQLLRRNHEEDGAPWLPIVGNEPDYRSATVAMTTWNGAAQLGDELRVAPRDSLGMSPLDNATNAVFWPRYLAEDATQELRFNAEVILADGTRDCCESQFTFDMYSSVPKVSFARVLPGGTVSDPGTSFVRTSDDAVAVSVSNQGSYPIYARLKPKPNHPNDTLVELPGIEVPHHPADPTLIEVGAQSTVRLQLPIPNDEAHVIYGGVLEVEVMASDVDAAGVSTLTSVTKGQVTVAPAPTIDCDELISWDALKGGKKSLKVNYVAWAGPSQLQLLVRDASGTIVSQLARSAPSEQGDLEWDGKLPNGEIVPTGAYTAELVASRYGADLGTSDPHPFTVLRVNLDVDTNRDGTIEDDGDEQSKDKWTQARGAIYAVNLDADEQRMVLDGSGRRLLVPDAVDFTDDGIPVSDDPVIGTPSDEEDLTPVVLRGLGAKLPPGVQIHLVVAEQKDLDGEPGESAAQRAHQAAEAIHVFPEIKAGVRKILGGIGSRGGGSPADLDTEITKFLDPEDKDNYKGKGPNGDATFGLEGLLFRNLDPAPPLHFHGEVDLRIEFRKGEAVLASDTIRLKVAPWIMLPNTQDSTEVWVSGESFPELWEARGLQRIPFAETEGSVWIQDHVETGYYQRPGGSKVLATLRAPYLQTYVDAETNQERTQPQPPWPRRRTGAVGLLRPGYALFQLGKDLGSDSGRRGSSDAWSGNKGGNLELLPPTAQHPLGTVVIGDTRSDRFKTFLDSQEVQGPPLEPSVDWLHVGHIDEAFSFSSRGDGVIVADPDRAYDVLKLSYDDFGERAVLFSTGETPITGRVVGIDGGDGEKVTIRFDQSPVKSVWRYLRFIDGEGRGQVAHLRVDPVDGGQGGNIAVDGDSVGEVLIAQVWKTGSTVVPPRAGGDGVYNTMVRDRCPARPNQESPSRWETRPSLNSRVVLVQDSLAWRCKAPAFITAKEVLEDKDLWLYNTGLEPGEDRSHPRRSNSLWMNIDANWRMFNGAAGGNLVRMPVPVLFAGNPDAPRSAVAFNPGMANGQHLTAGTGTKLYFLPRQYGPPSIGGSNPLEGSAAQSLSAGGLGSWRSTDDWDLYHAGEGEVHCGTSAVRVPLDVSWWGVLP